MCTGLGIAAAVGAVAAAGAGAYQADTQAKASKANNRAQAANYSLNRRLADEQSQMQKAGTVNARGDSTQYVEGVGWVERPSARTAGMIAASDNEELAKIGDQQRNRMRGQQQFRDQVEESGIAGALRKRIAEGPQRTQAQTQGLETVAALAEESAGREDMQRRLNLKDLREGGSGYEAAIGASNNAGMLSRKAILARMNAAAPVMQTQFEKQTTDPLVDRYNLFASRSTAAENTPFIPTSLDDMLSGTIGRSAAIAPQFSGSQRQTAPTFSNVDERIPQRIGSLAETLRFADQKTTPLWDSLYNRNAGKPAASSGSVNSFGNGTGAF